MKKSILISLAFLTAAAMAAEKKSAAPKQQSTPAPAQTKTAAAKSTAPSVPVKPVVPEKKQPFELWMTAQNNAHTAIKAKQYAEALAYFDEAAKAANKGNWKNYSLYEKVDLLVQLKRYDEALAQLALPVSRDRNTPYHIARTDLMRGEIYLLKEQLDEAESFFKRALEAGQNNWVSADAAIALGNICFMRKNTAGAVNNFRFVLDNPQFLPGARIKALLAEVAMLRKQENNAAALALLDKYAAMEQVPVERVLDMCFARSEILIAMKDLKGARAALEEGMKLAHKPAPYQASLFSRIADILYRQKNYRDAQNMVRRAKAVRGHEWGYDIVLHRTLDTIVAQENRERAIRERKARLERERKARLDRERKAKAERERKAKLEQERKAKLEKERKAKLEQERKAVKSAETKSK